MALPSYNPDDIYVKSPRVHFIGQYGSSHSAQDDIHMICIRSNFIPTSTSIIIWIPTSLQPIKQLPMIGHIIYMIYVQHSWIGIHQKVWSVSMEMGDILLVWYVHNNQLYCNDDGGINWFNNILEWDIIWAVYHYNIYLIKWMLRS